jgi:ribosomal protein S12 methylthiotransferase accessory factor
MIEAQEDRAFLEIDLRSEQGLALLRSVEQRYGRNITQAAALARRMFLLRSACASGLRFVGAETTPRSPAADDNSSISFSLSGSGETLEEAFVSCVGEGVERVAQIECHGDVTASANLSEIGDRVWPSAISALEDDLAYHRLPRDTKLAWMPGRPADQARGEAAGSVLLPADWCLRRAPAQVSLKPRTVGSVGVAAGPDFDWAASRAILELVERDAASLWWNGGRRGRMVALDDPVMAGVVSLLANLRQGSSLRHSWLLDITTDLGIPAIAALSCDHEGLGLAYGLAARHSKAEACRAAILELCQTELAIRLAHVKLRDSGEARLSATDRLHLERARAIKVDQCELLYPLGAAPAHGSGLHGSGLAALTCALARAGIEVALVDLTRPEFDIPTVRALAPALQAMPSDVISERLQRAIAALGGRAACPGGLPLI